MKLRILVFLVSSLLLLTAIGAEDIHNGNAITAVMISDEKQSQTSTRYQRYISNFTSLFTKLDERIIFKHIAVRESSNCSIGGLIGKDLVLDKFAVPNSAHIDAWKFFYAFHKGSPSHILLVFQHDACIGRSNAAALILEHTKIMTEDIMFFGYCFKSYGIPKFLKRRKFLRYHPRVTGLAPHCLHAYGLTMTGVTKLLNHVQECGPPLDTQIAALANKGLISFKFSNISYAPEYTKTVFAEHGVHFKVETIFF